MVLAPVSIIQAENDGAERAIPAKLALKSMLPDESMAKILLYCSCVTIGAVTIA